MADRAQAIVYKLCNISNRYTSINRLPTEILENIFFRLQNDRLYAPVDLRLDDTYYHAKHGLQDVFPWHRVGLVCRHWRKTSRQYPGLWDTIVVTQERSRPLGEAFALTCLEYSGVAPLTIHLNTYPASGRVCRDIKTQTSRIRELRLTLYDIHDTLPLAQCDASHLETLTVNVRQREERVDHVHDPPLFNQWQTPRLRSLFVNYYTGWRAGTFGSLRHLVIAYQDFTPATFRCFLHVLRANPGLEDLILSQSRLVDISRDEMQREILGLPSINMPRLVRLRVVHQAARGPLLIILLVESLNALLILPEGAAQSYERSRHDWPAAPYTLYSRPVSFTLQKLYIDQSKIMGTDGQSAIQVCGGSTEAVLRLMPLQEVKELWLSMYLYATYSNISEWALAIAPTRNVTKLIIQCDAREWLREFSPPSPFFPTLAELELHDAHESLDGQVLLEFLTSRKETGQAVGTMRFVHRYSSSDAVDQDALDSWRGVLSKLERVVDCVEFEERQGRTAAMYRAHPIAMQLPPVCTTPSTVHSFWVNWHDV